MGETFEEVTTYLRKVWHYRWLVISCGFLLSIIGWTGVAILPYKYKADAILYVETASVLQPLLEGLAVESPVAQEMISNVMRQALLSRHNLEAIARIVGIDKSTSVDLDEVIEELEKAIEINATGDRSDVYSIVYEHTDPKVAYGVVQALVDGFKDTLSSAHQNDSDRAQQFFHTEIETYESRLREAEQKLKEFKQRHVGLMPEDGRSYYERLQQSKDEYQAAILELNEAQDTANALGAHLVEGPAHKKIQAQIAKVAELQLRFTDQHPDVIAAKSVLEELKKQATSESTQPPYVDDVTESGIILKLQLSQAEARVAALQTRVAEYKRRVDALGRAISTIPDVEAELANLNRDYAVHKEKYERLVERRESAKISDRAENLKITVLEGPWEPKIPVKPRKILYSAIVFMMAVGTGVGLALSLSLNKPLIYSCKDLEKLTELPVIGTLSYVHTENNRPSRSFVDIPFICACLALLALYASLHAAYQLRADFLINLAGSALPT
ncbi:MAG: XrtA system polysaccharide chain length determinant [Gammaproteobacteria bacterium]